MANELIIPGLEPGGTDYYARFVDATGSFRRGDTDAFEAYDAGNVALYGAGAGSTTPYHVAVEVGSTGTFTIDVPPGMPAGCYTCLVYGQAGTEPTESDGYVGGGSFEWDGASIRTVSATAAEVWSHTQRTLTQSAAQIEAIVAGSAITLHRGDTLAISITGLGDVSGRSKLWFTGKRRSADEDSEAEIQIDEGAGLLAIAGASPVAGETATIVVDDEVAGNITVTISPAAAKKLRPTTTGVWDVQVLNAGGDVHTRSHGALKIVADVTRSVA